MGPVPSTKKAWPNGSPLTYKWLVGILLFVLFALIGSVWSLQNRQTSTERQHLQERVKAAERSSAENKRGIIQNSAEVAVVKTELKYIRQTVDEMKADVKLLVQHQGLR